MAFFLSPICNDQQTDANGNPLVGGKVYTYLAGSSTPAATYTDATGATPQANPIILNSLGLPASPIWLTGGVTYKFVIKTAAEVTIQTVDNVAGINDVSSTAQEWNDTGLVPTYLSTTQFSVPGDQTAVLQVNRRLRNKVTAGYAYGRISASVFSAGITTVTMVNDSTPLDSGISSVATGFLSAFPTSIPYGAYQTVGDSSQVLAKIQPVLATVNGSGGAPANGVRVTLNPTWLDFRSTTANSGAVSTVQVSSALTLDIPSGATLGTVNAVSHDIAILALNNGGSVELAVINVAGGTDLQETGVISTTAISGASSSATTAYSASARSSLAYRVVGFFRGSQTTAGLWASALTLVQGLGGLAAVITPFKSVVRLNTGNGYGSTNTCIRRFTNIVTNVGTDITYTDSASLGASFTVNVAGMYSITYIDNFSTAANMGISLNTTQPTTTITGITITDSLGDVATSGADRRSAISWTGYLPAGSVIRAHTDSNSGGTGRTFFTIARVG